MKGLLFLCLSRWLSVSVVSFVFSFLLCVPLFAADKTVVYKDCQLTVPAEWSSEKALPNQAASPDKKQVVTVTEPRFMDSFAQLKQAARSAYPKSKVITDTADNFEMEGTSNNGKPNLYRAISLSGGHYCIAEVTYETGSAEQGKKILQTLKAK